MSNIDKQWLQQKITEMEEHRDLFPGDLDDDHASVLSAFRIALASLEAEPVAYIIQDKADRKEGNRGQLSFKSVEQYHEKDINEHELTATPLYTAPPAPASVPAAYEHTEDFSEYHEGWNACRAAMLQGAAGNTPVIPDGWVLVPVDMAPEMMRAVQINSELGAYAAANLTGAYSLFREFWDVAVTAAPQQEVK